MYDRTVEVLRTLMSKIIVSKSRKLKSSRRCRHVGQPIVTSGAGIGRELDFRPRGIPSLDRLS